MLNLLAISMDLWLEVIYDLWLEVILWILCIWQEISLGLCYVAGDACVYFCYTMRCFIWDRCYMVEVIFVLEVSSLGEIYDLLLEVICFSRNMAEVICY
jgi:hypothetical protein